MIPGRWVRTQRAFYNAMRDYFTGVLAPGFGMDLPPFYQASDMARPTGTGMLLNGVDGRLLLIENNTLKPVTGPMTGEATLR